MEVGHVTMGMMGQDPEDACLYDIISSHDGALNVILDSILIPGCQLSLSISIGLLARSIVTKSPCYSVYKT